MTNPRTLLGIPEIRSEFGFGRDLATRLAENMPHIVVGYAGRGPKRMVHRSDLERVMTRATAENADLWALVKREDASSILAGWLTLSGVN